MQKSINSYFIIPVNSNEYIPQTAHRESLAPLIFFCSGRSKLIYLFSAISAFPIFWLFGFWPLRRYGSFGFTLIGDWTNGIRIPYSKIYYTCKRDVPNSCVQNVRIHSFVPYVTNVRTYLHCDANRYRFTKTLEVKAIVFTRVENAFDRKHSATNTHNSLTGRIAFRKRFRTKPGQCDITRERHRSCTIENTTRVENENGATELTSAAANLFTLNSLSLSACFRTVACRHVMHFTMILRGSVPFELPYSCAVHFSCEQQ